ncbi:MAG: glycosyltransferase family 39 protein [Aggregatilineales bacterium]
MRRLIRSGLIFSGMALIVAALLVRILAPAPAYTDAYYHFNAAVRLASSLGLTDTYLWMYIGAPEALPETGVFPSHLYWMPLTSLLAALGMLIGGQPGSYAAAQTPFIFLLAGTAVVGYSLGWRLGGTRRHAWSAGLITLFGGFFARFWGTIDTFAPYAFFGSLGLFAMGLALEAGSARRLIYWALAGAFGAFGHLTRADGLLLPIAGAFALLWPWRASPLRRRLIELGVVLAAYFIVMLPWFVRSVQVSGAPLPVGGMQTIWLTEYDDLFRYPPDNSFETFAELGIGEMLATRWEAFAGPSGLLSGNLGTFIAVEGMIVMTPFMLLGLWNRRRSEFLRPFWLYALGLHLAMTLVFPFPGYRGGLLHSAAALVPWWTALGICGIDDAVSWAVRRRRHWNLIVARRVFTGGLVVIVIFLSVSLGMRGAVVPTMPELYVRLLETVPGNARLLINDPAALYHYTGMGGAALPNSEPEVIREIAARYAIDYVVLEAGGIPHRLLPLLDDPPEFLIELPFGHPQVRLYAIQR